MEICIVDFLVVVVFGFLYYSLLVYKFCKEMLFWFENGIELFEDLDIFFVLDIFKGKIV